MSLEKVSEDLFCFLLRYIKNENKVKEIIQREKLSFLFPCQKCSMQYEALLKLKYGLAFIELQNLKQNLDKKKISFVVLKGISLARRLYKEPSKREFGDIDILVNSKDLYNVIIVLEKLGYISNCGTDEDTIKNFISQVSRELHFPPLYKKVSGAISFMIEVHIDIVSLWMFGTDPNVTANILKRRKIEEGLPIMDEYDTIIFQMMHLIKHFISEITAGFIRGIIDGGISLRGLHETALLIDKYIDKFDIAEFWGRVEEFGACKEVQTVLNWIENVYPTLSLVKKFSNSVLPNKCISGNFCEAISTMRAEKLLFTSPQLLASEIIDILHRKSTTLKCFKNIGNIDEIADWAMIGDDYNKNGNPFGTHKVYGRIDKKIDFTSRFCFMWDNVYLWFYINTEHSSPIFHQFMDDELLVSDNAQDFIRLFFDTGKRERGQAYANALIIKPKYNDKEELDIYVHKNTCGNLGKMIIPNTEYEGHISISEQGYSMKIGIKWEVIPLTPWQEQEFYADVLVGTDELEVTWQNASYNGWYHLGEYARILLQE